MKFTNFLEKADLERNYLKRFLNGFFNNWMIFWKTFLRAFCLIICFCLIFLLIIFFWLLLLKLYWENLNVCFALLQIASGKLKKQRMTLEIFLPEFIKIANVNFNFDLFIKNLYEIISFWCQHYLKFFINRKIE